MSLIIYVSQGEINKLSWVWASLLCMQQWSKVQWGSKAAYAQPRTRATKNPRTRVYWIHLRRQSWLQHTQGPHTPLRTHLRLSSRHTQQHTVTSHTGKRLHGISQHGTPTTVKGVMTPKGAQLNNYAHTHTTPSYLPRCLGPPHL